MTNIELFSDPQVVFAKAKRIYGPNVNIQLSTRKGKKYMIQKPNKKWVHFGALGYEDFTRHQDLRRRDKFITRNARFGDADKWSPAFMAYHILW